MEGTSEPKVAAPERKAGTPAKQGTMSTRTLIVVLAVVVILIIAIVAYAVLMQSKKGLDATVSPETLTMNAGASAPLEVHATWNGDSIDDSPNATFAWTVSDASLGSFSAANARNTNFVAGSTPGSGAITCKVSYTVEGDTSTKDVEVELVVNPPVLSLVEISPPSRTLVYDRNVTFNATAVDSLGNDITGIPAANMTWTVWGIPTENYTLSTTIGASVNFSANTTGTALLNVTVTHKGVTKTAGVTLPVIRAVPTLVLNPKKLPAGAGANCSLTEPTEPLKWDELIIQLTYETSTINWTLTMEGLDDGAFNMSQFAPQALGSLTVFLNITDVDGNGAVNSTDYFVFTASGGSFTPSGSYLITMIYEPTVVDIVAEASFNG